MPLISPYSNACSRQFKGNLHTHTLLSDGPMPVADTIEVYARLKYDFLMLSDHDTVTDVSTLDGRGMTLISGNEITANGYHLLHVNAGEVLDPLPDRQLVIDAIRGHGGFAIMNHPNWGESFIHIPQAELERLQGYAGIEIYNGVSERVEGNALATDRWDMLLTRGRRIWGFGNDDCHDPCDFSVAWNMVFAHDASRESILQALCDGCFYVSTGVTLDKIEISGNTLIIESRDVQCFRLIRDHGGVFATIDGSRLVFDLPDDALLTYFRVECFGAGARMAWTQPFWVNTPH